MDCRKYFTRLEIVKYAYCKKCKKCNKNTSNTFPKNLVLISKNKIKGKSKCVICLTKRSFIDEI